MLKFIAGLITGTAITVIGWQRAILAVVQLGQEIYANVR